MTNELFKILSKHDWIDWSTIYYALKNKNVFPENINQSLISAYAEKCLSKITSEKPEFSEVAYLAFDYPNNREETLARIYDICLILDCTNHSLAERKWRAADLEFVLNNLSNDPMYNLIDLSSFWSRWGWPLETPNSLLSDSIKTIDYGSSSHLNAVIAECENWLRLEHDYISSQCINN
ncbi:DUF2247 family protein [Delftia tsuruhatensis]|uniref:DUF2247 family protein n=1 Tax=Delftia tsuruhatensis TaxID=180282 RepID=UPI0031DE37EF